MKLTLIPAGEFLMGSPERLPGPRRAGQPDTFDAFNPTKEFGRNGEETLHRVRITKPFHMGVYEVTQEEYEKVMHRAPSAFSSSGEGRNRVAKMNTSRFPVESVSWNAAQEFCRRLSQKEGKTYRLPTEAEWEYACRAGTTTAFHFGGELNGTQANCDGTKPYWQRGPSGPFGKSVPSGPCLERTTAVGSYRPNGFGLYDMHGNVAEWCQDWYDAYTYSQAPTNDPSGPGRPVPSSSPNGPTGHVFRGGSWKSGPMFCRAAYRDGADPLPTNGLVKGIIGFRVVCELR